MDFEKLYAMRENFDRDALRAIPAHPLEPERRVALACGQWLPAKPLEFVPAAAGRPSDVVWSPLAGPMLVSQRVVDFLSSNGFTGWATYPVALAGRCRFFSRYHGFAVTGVCGPIDCARSTRVVKFMPKTLQVWMGLYFDAQTWDGSDIFRPVGTLLTLVTERVKSAFEAARIANVDFGRIIDFERAVP